MTTRVVFEINEPGFRYVFQSLAGPCGRDFVRKCRALETRAQLSVGVDTGATLNSIDSMFYTQPGGDFAARVGANPSGERIGVAFWHHEGTHPHVIKPRTARMLRFPDRRTGQIVFRHRVFHPGTKPNPYLTRHIREVVR